VNLISEVRDQFKALEIDSNAKRIARGCTTRPSLPPGCTDSVPLDQPITFYTQNLIEGNLFATPSDNANVAFHKNTLFSTRPEVNGDDHVEDLITEDYPTEIVDKSCNMTAGPASEITIRRLLHDAAVAIGEQGGLTVSRLVGSESATGAEVVHAHTLSSVLMSFKLPLNLRQIRALALCFGGKSAHEIVAEFNIPSNDGTAAASGGGDEAMPDDNGPPADSVKVWFTKKDLLPSEVEVQVDPTRVGRLSLPQDEPVLRALLRKVHRIVPYSVDRLEYI
jgi:hypothetical protein